MASNLRVDTILPSTGTSLGIGTASGTTTVTNHLNVTGNLGIVDKIVHTGDTNTSIRFPATDEITFETSGSERLRITSTGSVGLGINNPNDTFHVYHATDNLVARFESGDTGGGITLKDNTHVTSLLTTNGAFEINVDQGGDISGETISFKMSGSEKLHIASTGRVSIGNNTSPDGNLHVFNSSAGSVAADTSANLAVFESGETNSGITLLSPNTGKQQIYFGTTGTGGSYEAGIRYTHEQHGTTADRRAMHFRVGGGESARIQGGRLLVGRTNNIQVGGDPSDSCFEQITNNGYALTIHSNQSSQRGLGVYYPTGKTPEASFAYQIGSSWKTIIRGDGDLENANNSYGGISDVSMKENIVDANSQWNDIKNIKVRKFNYKAETGQQTHKQIGVIAQELETVSPKLVRESEGGMKTVSYSILYMKAIKALQEAQARIETLESKVAALEGS